MVSTCKAWMVSQAGALPASVDMALTKEQEEALENIKAWATPERAFNAELVRQLVKEAEVLLRKAESIARTENIPFESGISGCPMGFGTPIMHDFSLFIRTSYGENQFNATEMREHLAGIDGAEQLVHQIEDILDTSWIITESRYGWDRSQLC